MTVGSLNDPTTIERLLATPATWAILGCSPRAASVSEEVAGVLRQHGHRLLPVNPSVSGDLFGEPYRASLAELDEPVDVVDIFRRAEGVSELIDLTLPIRPKAIWLQLGAIDQAAAGRATAAGIDVVMDRCPVIEYRRRARA